MDWDTNAVHIGYHPKDFGIIDNSLIVYYLIAPCLTAAYTYSVSNYFYLIMPYYDYALFNYGLFNYALFSYAVYI